MSKAIANMQVIDGRYNIFEIDNKKIIIDFAHTPKSIDSLLNHIKETSDYNIISLFGCVGYSDKDKREEIASVIAKYSRFAIITTDNRGITSFKDIRDDIIVGLNNCPFVSIEDREMAIRYGFDNMLENDVLVLIGKGAENFQTIENERVPYSDRQSVEKLIDG